MPQLLQFRKLWLVHREQVRDQVLDIYGWMGVDCSGPAVPLHDLRQRELCRVHHPPFLPVGAYPLPAPEFHACQLWQLIPNRLQVGGLGLTEDVFCSSLADYGRGSPTVSIRIEAALPVCRPPGGRQMGCGNILRAPEDVST